MTRRLVAAAVLAGSFGVLAAPAFASHGDAQVCLGGQDRNNTGRVIGYCIDIENPLDHIGT
ncbi:MAG TPA: hypothetical protein VF519_07230 [Mycobacteriales bacterium]|jgi:hypothetical protein